MDLVNLGSTELDEDRERVAPADLGCLPALRMLQGESEELQGATLSPAVPNFSMDCQRSPKVVDGFHEPL
jgi:hypothetical protein